MSEEKILAACRLCPRRCGVNRYKRRGFCGADALAEVALATLHPWEEPCLVGEKGAWAVFFAHCSLRCVYCQNHEISQERDGVPVSVERLAQIFLAAEREGAATLDLVSPTHYLPQLLTALDMAKKDGLSLPVVYNSGGYEELASLDMLRGKIDIFLPDLKYREEASAAEYSGAADYFAVAAAALRRMVAITGEVEISPTGIMQKGVLVRHLVLPGHRHESMRLLDWLWSEFEGSIYLSLMRQYTPLYRAKEHPPLHRRLTTFEYESVVDHAAALGFTQCYVQEPSAASAEYVPLFDGRGVVLNM
ncbi:MAG: radical SAM protein [Selenomonadaceae bacterium]|nr:radical SAM protein [Selenomonadaceae bacterium]